MLVDVLNMKTKDSHLHARFIKFTENNKRKVKCKYCGHKSAENVTRMREHIEGCSKVPKRELHPVQTTCGEELTTGTESSCNVEVQQQSEPYPSAPVARSQDSGTRCTA